MPPKPSAIADHLNMPTGSRNSGQDKAQIMIGAENRIVAVRVSGKYRIAKKFNTVETINSAPRKTTNTGASQAKLESLKPLLERRLVEITK